MPSAFDFRDLTPTLADLECARRWVVAYSGGVDSTVLLHLLSEWCAAHPTAPSLSAIHINHDLQDEAAEWQRHCEQFCGNLGVPCHSHRVVVDGVGYGLEAAARNARYSVFEESLGAGDVLFTAHHLDDQVETFFLRLMRGAGLQGLAGIPRQRALGAGTLVRPLLAVPRAQLEEYARRHLLTVVDDPSNLDTDLDRNFLRAEVLPLLASRWPAYRASVSRAGAHLQAAARVLDGLVPVPETVYSVMGDVGFSLPDLLGDEDEVASVRLRNWLRREDLPAPDSRQLAEFLSQLRSLTPGAGPRLQCSAYTLQRYRDGVYVVPSPWSPDIAGRAPVLAPGEELDLVGVGCVGLASCDSSGLLLAPGECVEVTWRRGGERCRPLGRTGSRSLKKLLQEAAVPPWWRDRIPLFSCGGELLAVGDLWLCETSRSRSRPRPGEQLWRPVWQRNFPGQGVLPRRPPEQG